MLVLAITVLFFEHLRRGMRLITPYTKGDPDVAIASGDEAIKGTNLRQVQPRPRFEMCSIPYLVAEVDRVLLAVLFLLVFACVRPCPRDRHCSMYTRGTVPHHGMSASTRV